MAKQIKLPKSFEFRAAKSGNGGTSKYDWTNWLNGQPWQLEQSEGEQDKWGTVTVPTVEKDFNASMGAMIYKTQDAARKVYKVAQISRIDVDGKKLESAFILKARDMTDAERVAEDTRRAEKAADKKDKKAAEANGQHVKQGDGPLTVGATV